MQTFAGKGPSPLAHTEKLGPTGRHPAGKLSPDDAGECKIAIGLYKDCIVLDFGAPLEWVALDAQGAAELSETLRDYAIRAANLSGVKIQVPR